MAFLHTATMVVEQKYYVSVVGMLQTPRGRANGYVKKHPHRDGTGMVLRISNFLDGTGPLELSRDTPMRRCICRRGPGTADTADPKVLCPSAAVRDDLIFFFLRDDETLTGFRESVYGHCPSGVPTF